MKLDCGFFNLMYNHQQHDPSHFRITQCIAPGTLGFFKHKKKRRKVMRARMRRSSTVSAMAA